jgi:hypothetical protein
MCVLAGMLLLARFHNDWLAIAVSVGVYLFCLEWLQLFSIISLGRKIIDLRALGTAQGKEP